MTEKEIRAIVESVLSGAQGLAGGSSCGFGGSCGSNGSGNSCAPAPIIAEASARHVHLTAEAMSVLFGSGSKLVNKRDLSQPGEFLSEQRVKLVTQKGVIENVAVLGPERTAVQVELSMTDCRALGIKAPVNLSGDLQNAGDVYIVGEKGLLEAKGSVLVAKAHIHMRECDAKAYGVSDGQRVCVKVNSERPVTFDDVIIRVRNTFMPALHIDFDEANACALGKDTKIEIVCR